MFEASNRRQLLFGAGYRLRPGLGPFIFFFPFFKLQKMLRQLGFKLETNRFSSDQLPAGTDNRLCIVLLLHLLAVYISGSSSARFFCAIFLLVFLARFSLGFSLSFFLFSFPFFHFYFSQTFF